MPQAAVAEDRIEIASLADECYKRIKQDILTGKLGWGQRLNVINMAQAYGISRAPVIKAIDRLAMEQLVRIIPNVGSFVVIPTKEDVVEVTEIRMMLETTMCTLAYKKNKKQLLEKLAETRKFFNTDSPEDRQTQFDLFLEYDRGFHFLFAGFSENERLRVYYESIRNQIELFRTKTYFQPYVELAIKRHSGIIDALEADHLDEALTLLETHIRDVEVEALDSIENGNTAKEYK